MQKWIPRVKFSQFRHITHCLTLFSYQVVALSIFKMAAGRHLEYLELLKDLRWAPYLALFEGISATKIH